MREQANNPLTPKAPGKSAESAPTPADDLTTADPGDDGGASELPPAFDFLAPDDAGGLGRLGPYRVLEVLGHGGMGIVFLAEDPALHRQVALKVMLPDMAQKAAARERFLREARATAQIEHDHIVTIYQVGEDRGIPYLAMQLLRGMSLEDWLRQGNRPTIRQAARIAREAALGLAAAHARGLIHRDIKPANLWLEDRGAGAGGRDPSVTTIRVKILDFGLARPAESDTQLTRLGTILGTPSYMSPEQARGKDLDARSDLFSVGCVLYRLLAGVLPFTGPDAFAVMYELVNTSPRPLRELNPEVPAPLAELVDRLLAKEPERRPATARAAAEALQAIERELGSRGAAGASAAIVTTPVAKKRSAAPTQSAKPATAARKLAATAAVQKPPSRRALLIGLAGALGVVLMSCLSCSLLPFLFNRGTTVADGNKGETRDGRPPPPDKPPSDKPPPGVTTPVLARAPFGEDQAKSLQEQWAAFVKCPAHEVNPLGIKLVLLPPGEFDMGSSEDDFQKHVQKFGKILVDSPSRRPVGEGPVHKVRITRPFLMASTEVTVGQFRTFVSDQKYQTEAEKNGSGGTGLIESNKFGKGGFKGFPGGGEHKEVRKPEFTWQRPGFIVADTQPVCNVSWQDADAFCRWLSSREKRTYRLPTEAEWEYACRAGTTSPWSTGESASAKGNLAMWTQNNSKNTIHPVAQWPANPFGLHDMHGNVSEWCADFFNLDFYPTAAAENPEDSADRGKGHTIRGGSFHQAPMMARSAHRAGGTAASVQTGFRVVCEIPTLPAK
jgi:formylglycine-generating enzyme required for sulfatase activity/serine/threonine protein kinase